MSNCKNCDMPMENDNEQCSCREGLCVHCCECDSDCDCNCAGENE